MAPKRSQTEKGFLKKLPVSAAFLLGSVLGFLAHEPFQEQLKEQKSALQTSQVRVWFSPKGNCTQKIVDTIKNAKHSILVMAYSFTCPQIGQALINAHLKGVEVKILIDRSQLKDNRSQCKAFLKNGLFLWVDPAVGIAHNKVMIFDDQSVLTGSFNFTRNAELRNAENVLLIQDSELAKIYTRNWNDRTKSARALKPSRPLHK